MFEQFGCSRSDQDEVMITLQFLLKIKKIYRLVGSF